MSKSITDTLWVTGGTRGEVDTQPLVVRIKNVNINALRVTPLFRSFWDDPSPSLLWVDFQKITLSLTPVWLKVRGQGGREGLELLNCTYRCHKLDGRLIEVDLLAGALNVNMCKKHDEQHGGLQVKTWRVQVLFSGGRCRKGQMGRGGGGGGAGG